MIIIKMLIYMKAFEIFLKKIPMIDPFTKKEIKDQNGDQAYFNYRKQLWTIVRSTSNKQGIATGDVMKRSRIQFILEGAEDEKSVFLEQEQYEMLKKCIDEMKWIAASTYIADMIKIVREAKEVEVGKKEEKAK